jgi:hypothetical protein
MIRIRQLFQKVAIPCSNPDLSFGSGDAGLLRIPPEHITAARRAARCCAHGDPPLRGRTKALLGTE